jgi:hypothetical protein
MSQYMRRSRATMLVAGLLLLGGMAESRASTDRGIEEYRHATRRALHACAGKKGDHRDHRKCVGRTKPAVDAQFDAALIASFMDPAGRAALQRYHAAFLAALSGLPSRAGESPRGYEQRQAALRCALSHAWAEYEQTELERGVDRVSSR